MVEVGFLDVDAAVVAVAPFRFLVPLPPVVAVLSMVFLLLFNGVASNKEEEEEEEVI